MDEHFRRRVRRHLYYGQGDMVDLDKPSLPLTEFTVEYFKESVCQKLGHVDLDIASNLINKNSVSPCSMVMSLLYAKRLRQQNKDYLGSMSSSDVFFISMMLASKYMYDEGVEEEVYNDEWAASTDQEVEDVNTMETDFLDALDWSLFVKADEFEAALTDIERNLAMRAGLQRGWFTYSELGVLMNMDLFTGLWNNVGLDFSKLTVVMSAAYVTSLVSLLGSATFAAQMTNPLSSALVSGFSTTLAPMALSSLNLVTSLRPKIPSALMPKILMDAPSSVDMDNTSWGNPHTEGLVVSITLPRHMDAHFQAVVETQSEESDIKNETVESAELKADADPPDDPENPAIPHKGKSSMLSLWLVKSLLSQLWAVSEDKDVCTGQPRSNAVQKHCICANCVKRHNRRLQANGTLSSERTESNPSFEASLEEGGNLNLNPSSETCRSRLLTLLDNSGITFNSLPRLSDLTKNTRPTQDCQRKRNPSDTRLTHEPSYAWSRGQLSVEATLSASLPIGPVWHPNACMPRAIEVT